MQPDHVDHQAAAADATGGEMIGANAIEPDAIGAEAIAAGRIAVIAHTHPSVSKGGAEIAAYTLFRALRALGADVIFVATVALHERSRLVFATAEERAVFYDPARYENFYHLAPQQMAGELHALLLAERVRIADFHHFLHIGINLLRDLRQQTDIAIFLTLHEYLAICHHHGQMVTRPAQHLCHRASPGACVACFPEHAPDQFVIRREQLQSVLASLHGLIAPSRFLAGRFAEWGLRRPVAVIENGLAEAGAPRARRRADTAPSGAAERVFVFGFFARITPFKGIDLLLQAVALIGRDRRLAARVRIRIHGYMADDDRALAERFQSVLQAHDFVTAFGPYDNTEVQRLMADCDYVLMPSTWWENSPLVIQEAYAAGCPVIAANIGGMAEKVQDGVTGLQFRAREADDLVRVLRLAADAATLERLQAGLPTPASGEAIARQTLAYFADCKAAARRHSASQSDTDRSVFENRSR